MFEINKTLRGKVLKSLVSLIGEIIDVMYET